MRNSIVPKAPARKALCLAAMLAASALPYAVNAAPASGGDTVQGLYDALLGTIKNGRILGQSAAVDIGDGQVQMVYALDLHVGRRQFEEMRSLAWVGASGQRGRDRARFSHAVRARK